MARLTPSALLCVAASLLAGCEATLVERPGAGDLTLGHVLAANGDHTLAVAAWERAMAAGNATTSAQAALVMARAELSASSVDANPARAMRALRLAARSGDMTATLQLADHLSASSTTREAAEESANLYRSALEKHPQAALSLARLLAEGRATPLDNESPRDLVSHALQTLRWQADGGDGGAALRLGRFYLDTARPSLGASANRSAGEAWLSLAIQRGQAPAVLELARSWQLNHQPPRTEASLTLLESAADAGYPAAMYQLGEDLLAMASGDPSAQTRGLQWLREAAERDHVPAMNSLGRFLLDLSAEQPHAAQEAERWLTEAVRRRSVQAHVTLGKANLARQVPSSSDVYGLRLLQTAADAGAIAAMTALADHYLAESPDPEQTALAVSYLSRGAKLGSATASVRLAELYLASPHLAPDADAALRLLSQAGAAGSARAYVVKGEALATGRITAPDAGAALRSFQNAYDLGERHRAGLYLGNAYLTGDGVPVRTPKAVKLLEASAAAGSASAALRLAENYSAGTSGLRQSLELATKWYRRAAELGSPRAMRQLAQAYRHGTGVAADSVHAVEWNLRAARAGDPVSMVRHGWSIATGEIGPASQNEARVWFERGVALRPGLAKDIGMAYVTGRHGQQDFEQAAHWLSQATGATPASALLRVARAFETGHGVDRSSDEAARWYRAAARQGESRAMEWLATDAMTSGDAKGASTAVGWLEQAANAGSNTALTRLANMYAVGNGVTANLERSADLFRRAARQGNAEAQYRLGMMYLSGLGVPADSARARHWLSAAREGDFPLAAASMRLVPAQ